MPLSECLAVGIIYAGRPRRGRPSAMPYAMRNTAVSKRLAISRALPAASAAANRVGHGPPLYWNWPYTAALILRPRRALHALPKLDG